MAATNKTPVTGAGPFNGILTWVDQRFPLVALWKDHLSEYYAPKNFNLSTTRRRTSTSGTTSARSRCSCW
jgi:hypothetical protein